MHWIDPAASLSAETCGVPDRLRYFETRFEQQFGLRLADDHDRDGTTVVSLSLYELGAAHSRQQASAGYQEPSAESVRRDS